MLAKEGLVRLDPPVLTDLIELKAIHFDLSDMPRLCEWVGIAEPKKQQEIQIEKIQTFQEEVSDTFLYGYYEDILERLRTGQLVKDPNLGDELFFHFLNAMAKKVVSGNVYLALISVVLLKFLNKIMKKEFVQCLGYLLFMRREWKMKIC